MPRQKGMTQLELLRRKQAEIAGQLKAAEAKERERERQIDSRRKELLGAVIAEYLRDAGDSPLAKTLFELVGRKLTRPTDRALFPNLPVISAAGSTDEISAQAVHDTVQTSG
jgi:hypothetical protein